VQSNLNTTLAKVPMVEHRLVAAGQKWEPATDCFLGQSYWQALVDATPTAKKQRAENKSVQKQAKSPGD
jgi:hypothetical protein